MGRWNSFLERKFPLRPHRRSERVSFAALSKRVAFDQIFMYVSSNTDEQVRRLISFLYQGSHWSAFLPFFSKLNIALRRYQIAAFLGSMGLMEGRDARHIGGKFQDLYRPAILANWQVWPLAQVRVLSRPSLAVNLHGVHYCSSSTFALCRCLTAFHSNRLAECFGTSTYLSSTQGMCTVFDVRRRRRAGD